jgi:hypothetical protein
MVSSRNDMRVAFLPGILTRSINLPFTGENIVAVTIYDKREVVFVNVITNTIINTVDIGHKCWGTDFNMNRLAIRAIQNTSSYIGPNLLSC